MPRLIWFVLLVAAVFPQVTFAGQFQKPVYYDLGKNNNLPLAIVSADFNNDGNLDLAVADFATGVIKIMLGKGDGTFSFGKTIPTRNFISNMAVGDFNGDHNLDLAVVDYGGTGTSGLSIYLGNGDGTFTDKAFYQLGYEAMSAAVADFNGDGNLDIAVNNEGRNGKGNVEVFFGNGDGTFSKPTIYDLPNYPYSIAAADLNGDGRPDLAVAEYGAGVAILLNKGRGKFVKPVVYAVNPPALTDVAIADLNHDGVPDLVVATSNYVGVLLGKGRGTFGKVRLFSTKSLTQEYNSYAVEIADFNGDGNPDIAAVLSDWRAAGLFYGRGDGTFAKVVPIELKVGAGGDAITGGRLSNKKLPDLCVTLSRNPSEGGQVAVMVNSQ